jgi:hypothetical protein
VIRGSRGRAKAPTTAEQRDQDTVSRLAAILDIPDDLEVDAWWDEAEVKWHIVHSPDEILGRFRRHSMAHLFLLVLRWLREVQR